MRIRAPQTAHSSYSELEPRILSPGSLHLLPLSHQSYSPRGTSKFTLVTPLVRSRSILARDAWTTNRAADAAHVSSHQRMPRANAAAEPPLARSANRAPRGASSCRMKSTLTRFCLPRADPALQGGGVTGLDIPYRLNAQHANPAANLSLWIWAPRSPTARHAM